MRLPENTDDYLRDLLAARLGIDPAAMTPEAALSRDLGIDSLELVSLVMEIEEDLDLDIPDEDAAQLLTIKQWQDYVSFAAAARETQQPRQIRQPYKKAVGYH